MENKSIECRIKINLSIYCQSGPRNEQPETQDLNRARGSGQPMFGVSFNSVDLQPRQDVQEDLRKQMLEDLASSEAALMESQLLEQSRLLSSSNDVYASVPPTRNASIEEKFGSRLSGRVDDTNEDRSEYYFAMEERNKILFQERALEEALKMDRQLMQQAALSSRPDRVLENRRLEDDAYSQALKHQQLLEDMGPR